MSLSRPLDRHTRALRDRHDLSSQKALPVQEVLAAVVRALGDPEDDATVDRLEAVYRSYLRSVGRRRQHERSSNPNRRRQRRRRGPAGESRAVPGEAPPSRAQVYLVLVLGGFMSPSAAKPPKQGWADRIRSVATVLLAAAIWVTTWVLPVTFMIVMAWGCETHPRQLGRRAVVFYDGQAASVNAAIALAARRRDRGHDKRVLLRGTALFLSLAIPIGFIAYADHERKTVGFNWIGALGALLAISVIIAVGVVARRQDV